MKLRAPVTLVPPPVVCATCGQPVAPRRTEADPATGLLHVVGTCPAGHRHTETRPLPRRPAPPA